MRAIELSEFGFSNLRETQRESRPPQHGEVQIRMRAACLNYRDLLMVQGKYNPRQPLPLVPLSDGVGIVEHRLLKHCVSLDRDGGLQLLGDLDLRLGRVTIGAGVDGAFQGLSDAASGRIERFVDSFGLFT